MPLPQRSTPSNLLRTFLVYPSRDSTQPPASLTERIQSAVKPDYKFISGSCSTKPVPVAERSKQWVCSHFLAEIVGWNRVRGMTFVSFQCSVLSGRGLCDELSLIQSPTDCGASCVI